MNDSLPAEFVAVGDGCWRIDADATAFLLSPSGRRLWIARSTLWRTQAWPSDGLVRDEATPWSATSDRAAWIDDEQLLVAHHASRKVTLRLHDGESREQLGSLPLRIAGTHPPNLETSREGSWLVCEAVWAERRRADATPILWLGTGLDHDAHSAVEIGAWARAQPGILARCHARLSPDGERVAVQLRRTVTDARNDPHPACVYDRRTRRVAPMIGVPWGALMAAQWCGPERLVVPSNNPADALVCVGAEAVPRAIAAPDEDLHTRATVHRLVGLDADLRSALVLRGRARGGTNVLWRVSLDDARWQRLSERPGAMDDTVAAGAWGTRWVHATLRPSAPRAPTSELVVTIGEGEVSRTITLASLRKTAFPMRLALRPAGDRMLVVVGQVQLDANGLRDTERAWLLDATALSTG